MLYILDGMSTLNLKKVMKTIERTDVDCSGLKLDIFSLQNIPELLEGSLDKEFYRNVSRIGQKSLLLTVSSGLCLQGES